MDNRSNENLVKALALADELLILADSGDDARNDIGCGILYGTIRDCAYKLRGLAEQEIDKHKRQGYWVEPEKQIHLIP